MSQTQLRLAPCPKCGESTSQENNKGPHAYCPNCGYVLANPISKIDAAQSRSSEVALSPMNSQNVLLGISDLITRWVCLAKASDQIQKNYALSLSEVTRIVLRLKWSKEIALRASEICGDTFERSLTRGRAVILTSAAAVFAACRLSKMPITINEMAEESNLPSNKLAHAVAVLTRELRLTLPPIDIQTYASKLLDSMGMKGDDRTTRTVMRLLTDVSLGETVKNRNPVSMASALVYLSSQIAGERKTQREIGRISHITETTIRVACRTIERACPHLLTGIQV